MDPFIGEIKMVAFNFAPKGWAMCNGQLLPINQNQALFSILGTTYGGNGQTTFALPDFRGRAPMHVGANANLGQQSGVENVTLLVTEIPAHTHLAQAGASAATASQVPAGNYWGPAFNPATNPVTNYQDYRSGTDVVMNDAAVSQAGGSQPHNNMQPYLVLTFIIALQGVFPSQN